MTSSFTPPPDLIDHLAGIAKGDPLDALRSRRADARSHSQQSYQALFEPAEPLQGEFTRVERFAVAAFVAALHRQVQATQFHVAALARLGASEALIGAVAAEAAAAVGSGPYGRFPEGPLSAEDAPGPRYEVGEARRAIVGARLAAALVHAHVLVFHPRDASARELQALLDAGWSADETVTLSQLVAFVAYQLRVAAGLGVLAASIAGETTEARAS